MKPNNYVAFSQEESAEVQQTIDAVLLKHDAEIVIAPVFTVDGRVTATAHIFKKVKQETENVPSDFMTQENGSEPTEKA